MAIAYCHVTSRSQGHDVSRLIVLFMLFGVCIRFVTVRLPSADWIQSGSVCQTLGDVVCKQHADERTSPVQKRPIHVWSIAQCWPQVLWDQLSGWYTNKTKV